MKDLKIKDGKGFSENIQNQEKPSDTENKRKRGTNKKNDVSEFFTELEKVTSKYNAQICLAWFNSKVQLIVISR